MQKSVPLFVHMERVPRSPIFKRLLREALRSNLEPLGYDQMRKLRGCYRGRKRVYLSRKDKDLVDFFSRAPIGMQYAVFLYVNEKLKEGQ